MKIIHFLLSLLMAIFVAGSLIWAGEALNINTASVKELRQVEGIGSKIAARIVAYRDVHGPFKRVDDLLKIKGIGKKRLAKARDELSVGDGGD